LHGTAQFRARAPEAPWQCQAKKLPSLRADALQGRELETSVVPPWFTAPSQVRPWSCGSGSWARLTRRTAGRF